MPLILASRIFVWKHPSKYATSVKIMLF